jgi:hypothetical protein
MSNLSDFFGSSGTIASIQRGTTTIAISQAGANTPMSTFTNTATINSVDVTKSTLNISVANGMYGRYYSNWGLTTSISANGTLTNATTLTFTAGKGFSNYTALGTPEAVIVQWEIIEYV